MRILHVLPYLDQRKGGPVRAVLDLSAAALQLGLDNEVVGIGALNVPDNPLPEENIHSMSGPYGGSYAYSRELAPWLDRNLSKFDGAVVHGAWSYPGWATARACWQHRIPYAAFPHGMLEPWAVNGQGFLKSWKKKVYWHYRERKVFDRARRVFFTTEKEQSLANQLFAFPAQQSILPPYGMEVHERVLAPEHAELAQTEGLRVALFLSRLHPKKNLEFLIRCWHAAELRDTWRLVIAGPAEPAYLRSLQDLARQLGICGQIQFVGFVAGKDRAYLFSRADWFLLPSKQENFGIAVLEAVASGCAVAISDRVYLAESFRPESEVLPLDESHWVDFFKNRMVDSGWRDKTAHEDRVHLTHQFETSRVAESWVRELTMAFGPAGYDAPRKRASGSCSPSEGKR